MTKNNRPWYEANRWRQYYEAQRRFRISAYIFPSGWFSHSWRYGEYLPYGWYSARYYLDWWSYGLPMPPVGTEWVRVGRDALLVDIWTGEVLSVYHLLFW